ncbi:MAG: succinate dehydrogenase/fumarate reductase iron-sulfur subunit [Nitrospinota bacterium]|nr:succinate dehydrogenase/fumarate reductase iron-sulfur subunit [Nitrospinota bacterium]
MKLTLRVWRQQNSQEKGHFETYEVDNIMQEMSFLEMLDVTNEQLILDGKKPIAFDYDCREGICGMCSLVINGKAHGGNKGTTTCQLHMRFFEDGDTITIEPFRSKAFPVIKDLIVDRSSFDRIIQKGGYISANSGSAPDGNSILVPKQDSDLAMDAAQCIGCGACVASCPNGSAMLFVSAKVSHLSNLPQGHPERKKRVLKMVEQMDGEGFGNCTNHAECEAACPKEISISHIAKMNREFISATLSGK